MMLGWDERRRGDVAGWIWRYALDRNGIYVPLLNNLLWKGRLSQYRAQHKISAGRNNRMLCSKRFYCFQLIFSRKMIQSHGRNRPGS